MNPDLSKKAILAIEALCELGCTEVNQLIENARNGEDIETLSEFGEGETKIIIDELSQIMSVYETDQDNNCKD